jgi:hypothetical protein
MVRSQRPSKGATEVVDPVEAGCSSATAEDITVENNIVQIAVTGAIVRNFMKFPLL